jgi:hypothetical protein
MHTVRDKRHLDIGRRTVIFVMKKTAGIEGEMRIK